MSVPPESESTPPAPPSAAPPQPPPAAPPEPPLGATGPSSEERQWALLAHLAALLGFAFPFGNVVGPLLVWLIKRDGMPFVDDQGKEAVNFNITVAIAALICTLLFFVLIGFALFAVVGVVWLVLVVLATVRANNGERYRYPFALRLIK